jgi:hypothetical protein
MVGQLPSPPAPSPLQGRGTSAGRVGETLARVVRRVPWAIVVGVGLKVKRGRCCLGFGSHGLMIPGQPLGRRDAGT